MAKAYATRLQLPMAETLHIVSTFKEIVRGVLTGWNQRNDNPNVKRIRMDRTWTEHILADKSGSQSTVITYFGRFEFQDGKRKEGTQKYHGSGRPHLHLLVWLQHVEAIQLENQLSATVGAEDDCTDPFTSGYVTGDATTPGKSGCAVFEGNSGWDYEDHKFRLRHTETDYCDGRRTYFTNLMEALKCHQDVQIVDSDREGRWILGRYVGTYVAKFSDSMAQDIYIYMCDPVKNPASMGQENGTSVFVYEVHLSLLPASRKDTEGERKGSGRASHSSSGCSSQGHLMSVPALVEGRSSRSLVSVSPDP